jgi:hypothetical protein
MGRGQDAIYETVAERVAGPVEVCGAVKTIPRLPGIRSRRGDMESLLWGHSRAVLVVDLSTAMIMCVGAAAGRHVLDLGLQRVRASWRQHLHATQAALNLPKC